MNPMMSTIATLAVSTIYILWHAYRQIDVQRNRLMRERIAFMLWTAAMRDDCDC
jgi:hypothetical protein